MHGFAHRHWTTSSLIALLASWPIGTPNLVDAQELRAWTVRPEASRLYVLTHKSGLLSFLGHEHVIVPGEWNADLCLADPVPAGARASLVVRTASLAIDADSARAMAGLDDGPGEDDRREIQQKLLSASNLDAEQHSEIRLDLTAGAAESEGGIPVRGTITVRGIRRDVAFPMNIAREGAGRLRLSGTVRIHQRDFGIDPESIAGVVRVSNEVDLLFTLAAYPTDSACPGTSAGLPRGPEDRP